MNELRGARALRRLLVAAAALLALPAAAETLTPGPVLVELKKWCTTEKKAEGLAKAGPYCSCVTRKAKGWLEDARGREQQSRLWTLMFDVLPDSVTTEEAYARAAEAGLSRRRLEEDMIVNYHAIDTFLIECVPEAD